jgi:lipoprotein-releasing system permease protein
MMSKDLSFFIAIRFLRSRKQGFLSFVTALAFSCVALGVAVLIVVTSVMNGFETELRERILKTIPHASIEGIQPIKDWRSIYSKLKKNEDIVGLAPFIESQSLLSNKGEVFGTKIFGILPEYETSVSVVEDFMLQGSFDSLKENSFNIVLGLSQSRKLNVGIGDEIALMIPDANATFAGYFPKIKTFTVSGIFRVGSPELDQTNSFINLSDAAKLMSLDQKVHGIRLKFNDLFKATSLSWIALGEAETQTNELLISKDWTNTYGSLFEAIMQERVLVGLLLFLIIVVAAFNIISMLVMMINDKRSQLAILKTIGMSNYEIQKIFVYLGSIISIIGTFIGLIIGLLLTYFLSTDYMEALMSFLMRDSYFIDYFPTDVRWFWVFMILFASLITTISVCLYPARLASKIYPSQVLRNE